LLIVASFLLLSACCPLVKNNLGDIKLTEADRAWIPYTGNESLVFEKGSGLTIKFQSGGRSLMSEKQNTTSKEACDYYMTDKDETVLTSENGKFVFRFELLAKDAFGKSYAPYLIITSNPNDMQGANYFICPSLKSMCEKQSENFSCNNTLTLGTKTYTDVIKITNTLYYMNGTTEMVKIVHYNKESGLLRFELDNGAVWSLKN